MVWDLFTISHTVNSVVSWINYVKSPQVNNFNYRLQNIHVGRKYCFDLTHNTFFLFWVILLSFFKCKGKLRIVRKLGWLHFMRIYWICSKLTVNIQTF